MTIGWSRFMGLQRFVPFTQRCNLPLRVSPSSFQTAMASTQRAVDCNHQDLFEYTAGRWLWNEAEQLARRRVHFSVDGLMQVTARTLGSAACIEIEKLSEGNFNKTFLLTMSDGKQAVARLPNPNAGRPHFSTASEVATMDFVRNVLQIPAPKVLDWNSCASSPNPVHAEYIIMEKVRGKELARHWDSLTGKQKYAVVQQLVNIEQKFTTTRFAAYGSLYYKDDITLGNMPSHLYTDVEGVDQVNSKFVIGPTNSRMYFDDGRSGVDIDRGPWASAAEYMIASARREIACLAKFSAFPRPQGTHNAPRQYQQSVEKKLSVLHDYLKVAPYLLPKSRNLHASVMWHSDLHSDNIFVDPTDPAKIVGIIDWQSVHLSPLFLQTRTPALLNFDGPLPETFNINLPENFDSLAPEEQEDAKKLRSMQSLYKLYEVACFKSNPDAYQAVRARKTLGAQVSGLIGSVFNDGEPYLQGLLMAVQDNWEALVRDTNYEGTPCPLDYSAELRESQRVEQERWEQSIELMDSFLQEIGAYGGWDGWVCPADYDSMKSRLCDARERFLSRHSMSNVELDEWRRVFPFPDV